MPRQVFYYSEGPYLRSLQSLHYALMNSETFIQFMGSPDSGKTTLCDKLALYMERKGHEVYFIDRALDSPEMLRSVLANKYNLPSSINFARLLEDSLAQAEEKTRVLIFDDAHLLSDITLIEIHRLSEIQVNSKRLLNIVLCGEPQLEKRLSSKSEFKSLALNVSHKFLLEPMSQEEVGQFVADYLVHDQLPNTPISTAALTLISRTTKGLPGPATLVAQLIADARRESSNVSEVSKEELARLIKTSNIQAALPVSQIFDAGQLKVIAPIAAVFAIAVLGFLFQLTTNSNNAPAANVVALESEPSVPALAQAGESPFVSEQVEPVEADPAGAPAEIEVSIDALANLDDANAVAVGQPAPAMPSLLRPAPLFSLEEEEPVSDSSLSLVTAAEIGVTGVLLQAPEFAELVAIEVQQIASAGAADASASAPSPVSPQPAPMGSDTASVSDIDTAVVPVADPAGEAIADTTVSNPEQDAEVSESEPASFTQVSSSAAVESEPLVAQAQTYREVIDEWLVAWADRDMEGYFASYDQQFEPRYDDTLNLWRRNRTRVITNASSIKLNLSEFSLVAEDDTTVEVNFWLDYESPTYSDSTLKKLVLSNQTGRWLILEEVNLQVRS
jgi:MSHA biogenesis protein MshM